VERNLVRRLFVDAGQREVDERQLVARRERPGDALARGDVLLDQRLGEGPVRAAPDQRKPILRNEAGRRQ
jgi:hypothetical protein